MMHPYQARVIRDVGEIRGGQIGWVVGQWPEFKMRWWAQRTLCQVEFTFGDTFEGHFHLSANVYLDDLERV